uniref:Uncharacterized protein n=1 Tax=Glossina pallidipes TaxID=7398 RepID=A0A1B0A0D8_GLOPL
MESGLKPATEPDDTVTRSSKHLFSRELSTHQLGTCCYWHRRIHQCASRYKHSAIITYCGRKILLPKQLTPLHKTSLKLAFCLRRFLATNAIKFREKFYLTPYDTYTIEFYWYRKRIVDAHQLQQQQQQQHQHQQQHQPYYHYGQQKQQTLRTTKNKETATTITKFDHHKGVLIKLLAHAWEQRNMEGLVALESDYNAHKIPTTKINRCPVPLLNNNTNNNNNNDDKNNYEYKKEFKSSYWLSNQGAQLDLCAINVSYNKTQLDLRNGISTLRI